MTRIHLLSCLLGVSLYFVVETVCNEAIVGAEKADIIDFPYQVSVQVPHHGHDCGGAILSDRYILTSAHCVYSDEGKFYGYHIFVVAGTHDLHKPLVSVKVKKILVPKEYQPPAKNSIADLAVLKLVHPLELATHNTHLRALELPDHKHDYYVGRTVKIAGFGWDSIKINITNNNLEEDGKNSDKTLKFAVIDILNTEECRKDFPNEKISDKQICAKIRPRDKHRTHGVCTGDSGGPLVVDGKILIGILSYGPLGCDERLVPALYTDVSYYLRFINHAMKNKIWHNDLRVLRLI